MRTATQLRQAPVDFDLHLPAKATIGEELRSAREEAGLTLKEAAAAIGYTWVAVERWELGRCLPKPGVLWHLRQVYARSGSISP